MCHNKNVKTQGKKLSSLVYILMALVPYSEQNLLLSYSPSRFFTGLQHTSGRNQKSLKDAYRRGVRAGYINSLDSPLLTLKGRLAVQPYSSAQKLKNNKCLIIVFDIPESLSQARRQLRRALQQLGFVQVQKSVWTSEYNHRSILLNLIEDANLKDYVELFEASKITKN